MTDSQLRDIVLFIKGTKNTVRLNCSDKKEGKALHDVLSESRTLYSKLHDESTSLDEVLDQVRIKTARAKEYYKASGEKWLF